MSEKFPPFYNLTISIIYFSSEKKKSNLRYEKKNRQIVGRVGIFRFKQSIMDSIESNYMISIPCTYLLNDKFNKLENVREIVGA